MSQDNLVALISGSTRGIGKAIAERLINDGYMVFFNSRKEMSESEQHMSKYLAADVTSPIECKLLVEATIATFGRLDLLVCNVGTGVELDNKVSSTERWDHYLRSNLLSATNLIDAALAHLKETKGSVVAISSICGSSINVNAPVEYSVAKTALNAYIKLMAMKYGEVGVRFNAVSPGNVIFENSTWEKKIKLDPIAVENYINQNVPLKDFINPEEVAAAVSFLSSLDSKSTTGTILTIDGGQSL